MTLAISLIVYILTLIAFARVAKDESIDFNKKLTLKEKIIISIWFALFLSSQVLVITSAYSWLVLGKF